MTVKNIKFRDDPTKNYLTSRIGTIKTIFEGPRWAKLPTFIKDLCWSLDLELEMEVDKGWIQETVRIKVTGKEPNLRRFMDNVNKTLTEYNEKLENRND